MFCAFAYIGADLHTRLDLSFSAVGLVLAAFGIGGLTYVVMVRWLVDRLGQIGLVPPWRRRCSRLPFSRSRCCRPGGWRSRRSRLIGLAFHMVHNTLQVNATQMAPEARSTALGVFSFGALCRTGVGVAAAAPVVDRYGAVPVFLLPRRHGRCWPGG